ncbi:MAG: hypothetical protein ACI85O_003849 [Saprospiraceae bacterium]
MEKVEKLINRKVRYLIFTEVEFDEATFKSFEQEPILLWVKE